MLHLAIDMHDPIKTKYFFFYLSISATMELIDNINNNSQIFESICQWRSCRSMAIHVTNHFSPFDVFAGVFQWTVQQAQALTGWLHVLH